MKKQLVGIVLTSSTDKTIRVKVERRLIHPVYKKTIRRSKNFLVHDQNNTAEVGDKVEITETRPLSKRKRWLLVRVIEKAKQLN